MKLISVIGVSQSGKTSVIEKVIRELRRRRYSVGSVKEIHFEAFAMDEVGTNTYRHAEAGADLVTARGLTETDLLFKRRLSLSTILSFYNHDYVILEGSEDIAGPIIVTANTPSEVDARLDERVIAISGRISNDCEKYQGVPVINAMTNAQTLADLIEDKAFFALPDFPRECCGACGLSCRELAGAILRGERKRSDCVLSTQGIELYVGENQIDMVPFVQTILRNAVEGVVRELDGYQRSTPITIRLNPAGDPKTNQQSD